MQEIWKDIPGYEGLYEVSNLGNVRSLNKTVKARGGKTRVCKGIILQKTLNEGYVR